MPKYRSRKGPRSGDENGGGNGEQALEPSSRARGRKIKDSIQIREREDAGWKTLMSRIGGKDGLLSASMVSQNPKALQLAELLSDPAFAKCGTKDLARKAGLTAAEVVDIFRDERMMETILVLHDGLPEVVQGAMDDAKPKMEPCAECKGSGLAENGDTCWICRGKGEVRKPGDRDKLQFVGTASKLIEKGGQTINFGNQVVLNQTPISSSFEEMVRRATVNSMPKKAIEGVIDVYSTEN